MSRSQRHKIAIQNTSSRGEIYAEGRVAPAVLLSATPATPAVPTGPTGGPLKGSSMMGAVPVGWSLPLPKSDGPFDARTQQKLLSGPGPYQEPPPDNPGQRTFPIGPLPLLRVEPSEDPVGVWYVFLPGDSDQLREGDEVTIEATGSSATNGNYTVTQLTSNDETRFFVPGLSLPAPIEAKGRVTITDEGNGR